jgi:hypothetical protein
MNMPWLSFVLLSSLFDPTSGLYVSFKNYCEDTPLWPVIEGSPPIGVLEYGHSSDSFYIPVGWHGRLWADEDCDRNGVICNISKHVTLVEATVNQTIVWYDISLGIYRCGW